MFKGPCLSKCRFIVFRMRGGEPDMEKVANARRTLGENLDVYEKILSKQQFIGGEVNYYKRNGT